MTRVIDRLLSHSPTQSSPTQFSPTQSSPTQSSPTLSFEFFPPASVAATDRLLAQIDRLDQLRPDFVSITCGAGGSTRTRTGSLACGLDSSRPYPVMPHMTAAGHSVEDIKKMVDRYAEAGITNLLVLAGDPPTGPQPRPLVTDYRYASELVDAVKGMYDLCVGVAAFPEIHPRSSSRRMDRVHLADKLEKADFGITQFFFDATHYFQMMGELRVLGSSAPVIPGVIPVGNPSAVRRFAEMNGAEVPEALFARLEAASDSDREKIAVDHAANMVAQLLDGGAPGVHFYTLNRATLVEQVVRAVDRW